MSLQAALTLEILGPQANLFHAFFLSLTLIHSIYPFLLFFTAGSLPVRATYFPYAMKGKSLATTRECCPVI